jgi:Ca2+-binding EF-hand superfamily protein
MINLTINLLFIGAFKFCDGDGDGWISFEDLVESVRLSQQLMGKMFDISSVDNGSESLSIDDDDSSILNTNTNDDPSQSQQQPEIRAKILFDSMDSDSDGRASLEDFKRTVLNDSEIIQAFLVYDGVI